MVYAAFLKPAVAASFAVMAASCSSTPPPSGPDTKLAEALAGKVAEAPRSCINLVDARSAEVLRDVIVYRTSRKLIYVNSTPGCRSFTNDPIFVNKVFGSQLCRGDSVQFIERAGGVPGPICLLGDFTPYRVPR
jgi:hypothetical protein